MPKTTEEAQRERATTERGRRPTPTTEEPAPTPTTEAPTTTKVLLAHVVEPSSKLEALNRGEVSRVRALCGRYVTRPALPAEDVCRTCFDLLDMAKAGSK